MSGKKHNSPSVHQIPKTIKYICTQILKKDITDYKQTNFHMT